MSLEMTENKIAIIPLFDPDKSKGGIWIPDQAKERSDQGIVKYCGPKCELIQEGDYIMFPGYSGQNVWIDGEGFFIIMREVDVVAKIVGEDLANIEIPGLYFKSKDKGHFTATYDQAMDLIGRALQESSWHGRIKARDPRLMSNTCDNHKRNKSIKEYFNAENKTPARTSGDSD